MPIKTVRDLRKEIKAHPGEFVLVIESYEESHGCAGFGGKLSYSITSRSMLGVLDVQPKFRSLSQGWKLPTSRYIVVTRDVDCEVVEGVLTATHYDWGDLDWLLEHDVSLKDSDAVFSMGYSKPALQALVGDQAILEWAQEQFEHVRADLQGAAEKLGRSFDETPELDAERAARREGLIDLLIDRVSEVGRLQRRIDEIARSKGGAVRVGAGITLVEDDDDLKVVTWSQRSRLKEIKEETEHLLPEIAGLRLLDSEITRRLLERLEISAEELSPST